MDEHPAHLVYLLLEFVVVGGWIHGVALFSLFLAVCIYFTFPPPNNACCYFAFVFSLRRFNFLRTMFLSPSPSLDVTQIRSD